VCTFYNRRKVSIVTMLLSRRKSGVFCGALILLQGVFFEELSYAGYVALCFCEGGDSAVAADCSLACVVGRDCQVHVLVEHI